VEGSNSNQDSYSSTDVDFEQDGNGHS